MRVSVAVRPPARRPASWMVKVVPWPGRLSTLIRPPMAAISERASNAPMPKPPDLGRGEGLEQAVADEVAVHAGARVDDRDRHRCRRRRRPGRSPAVRGARVDRVLDEMADRLLERGRLDRCAHRLASPRSWTSWSRRLAAIAAVRIARQRLRLDALDARRRMRREPREQIVHLADRSLAASRPCRRGIRDCRRAARRCGRAATAG